jgi:hypothetical protein
MKSFWKQDLSLLRMPTESILPIFWALLNSLSRMTAASIKKERKKKIT